MHRIPDVTIGGHQFGSVVDHYIILKKAMILPESCCSDVGFSVARRNIQIILSMKRLKIGE